MPPAPRKRAKVPRPIADVHRRRQVVPGFARLCGGGI